jgi:predicted nucleic acid-binding Zn ribbon protein
MDRELAPCLDCGAAVPVEATTCPNCAYDVGHHNRQRFLLGGLGMVMSLSVVLAPVGLPLLWQAHRKRLAVDGSVTRRQTPDPAADLVRVLRGHLSLDGWEEAAGERRRGAGGAAHDALDVSHDSR